MLIHLIYVFIGHFLENKNKKATKKKQTKTRGKKNKSTNTTKKKQKFNNIVDDKNLGNFIGNRSQKREKNIIHYRICFKHTVYVIKCLFSVVPLTIIDANQIIV